MIRTIELPERLKLFISISSFHTQRYKYPSGPIGIILPLVNNRVHLTYADKYHVNCKPFCHKSHFSAFYSYFSAMVGQKHLLLWTLLVGLSAAQQYSYSEDGLEDTGDKNALTNGARKKFGYF